MNFCETHSINTRQVELHLTLIVKHHVLTHDTGNKKQL